MIAAYTFAAYRRQGVWMDDLSLWRGTANVSPDHPLPHTNYGLALSNAGRFDEATREFEIALSPEMNDSPRGRAVTANNMGSFTSTGVSILKRKRGSAKPAITTQGMGGPITT